MEQLITERLQENLGRLKLIRASEILDTLVQQAELKKSSYLAFLDHLLEEEVAAKEKRRIQTAMKTAGLPTAKTLEEYNFTSHPHLDKMQVMHLFDLAFIPKHENVIFLGPPSVGKTHLAIALAIKAWLPRLQGLFHHHEYPDPQTQRKPPVQTKGLSLLQSRDC